MTKLRPIGSNVLIRLKPRVEQSAGGIAIPLAAQKAEQWGDVVAIGNEVDPSELAPGDEGFIPAHLGTHYIEDGRDFILIPVSKVLAKCEPQTTAEDGNR